MFDVKFKRNVDTEHVNSIVQKVTKGPLNFTRCACIMKS